ncbi:MAG: rhomboid family intramembrane serine protease [Verrucomicrobia bacterium]|nr:rhomboid family intramembrane serine protease [Verrucomicrobiota bacterium]
MRRPKWKPPVAVPATVVLLAANVAVFVLVEIYGAYQRGHGNWAVSQYFALSTSGMGRGWIWQLLTFQFLHVSGWHLIMNLFGLYLFGRAIEEVIGKSHFYRLYLGSGIVGGLLQWALGVLLPARFDVPVLGASAGVFGLVAAFSVLNPDRQILLFFLLPLRARHFLWIAGGISLFYILVPAHSGIAHAAHLGGLMGGVLYIQRIMKAGREFTPGQPLARRRPRGLVRLHLFKSQSGRAPVPRAAADGNTTDFISREVDPILDKISAEGLQSLTPRERKILEAARSKMERR